MLYVFDNVISTIECQHWINKSPKIKKIPERYEGKNRVLNINDEPISEHVKNYLENKTNIKLELFGAELTVWPEECMSPLHVHTDEFRMQAKYNSILYLNDNFDGGEFITESITVNPVPGRLTLFDGSVTMHGLNKVTNGHRYTILFWWKR
jgi:hypothetical protein